MMDQTAMVLAQNNSTDTQSPFYVTSQQSSIYSSIPSRSISQNVTPTTSAWQHVSSSSTQHGTSSAANHNGFAERTDPEEIACISTIAHKIKERRLQDEKQMLHPDVDTPFSDQLDVISRLLPYHIFQQPTEDLTSSRKGKGKALDPLLTEIRETKFALECHRRQEAIRNRWRNLKIRVGQRCGADDQAYYLAQVVLESDRSENAWLTSELRSARAESERIEREKRAAANAARMTQFNSTPQPTISTMQTQYYRPYPYGYTQAYGVPQAAGPSISTFPVSNMTPVPATYAPYQATSAIPVQLPVASLPALHALGIIPVPVGALPPEGQPQPAAVLKGSSANGTILSLEINVSLLQSAQMSGLAMVLNSLVSRSSSAAAPPPSVAAKESGT